MIFMNKRNSIQRQMILDAFGALYHPTASDIYEHIREKYPSISLATVYRNLGYMAESGAVEKISFPGEPDRFETVKTPHAHAICRKCGAVCDIGGISQELLRKLDESVEAAQGFTVTVRNLNFVGVCAACRKKADNPAFA